MNISVILTVFILQVPYDAEDALMDELMQLAHEFLQNFCLGNPQNQAILHNHLDLFLNAGVSLFVFSLSSFNLMKYYKINIYRFAKLKLFVPYSVITQNYVMTK